MILNYRIQVLTYICSLHELLSTISTAVVIYCYVIDHRKTEWLQSTIINSLANESVIWARLGRESQSLLYKASAGVAQQQTEGSVFKIALSCEWQVGAACWLLAASSGRAWGNRLYASPCRPVYVVWAYSYHHIWAPRTNIPRERARQKHYHIFDLLVYGRNTTWHKFCSTLLVQAVLKVCPS